MPNGLYVRILGDPPMPPPDADFAFTINFAKGEGDPRRVFDAASKFIDGLEELDGAVAGSVGSRIKTLMVLEDIEAGSLKTFLKTILEDIDDESLKAGEWKAAIGPALVRAKHVAIEYLNKTPNEAAGGVDPLRRQLEEIATQTDARHLPDYAPIHEGRLVASLDRIQDAKRTLGRNDRMTIEAEGRVYDIDLSQTWEPSEIIPVQGVTETHSDGEAILTIRKPDLLGQAMWQFSHGKSGIYAKISDERWLRDFHERKIALRSGDALKCRVRFTYIYDENGVLIEQKYEIIRVLDIIQGSGPQLDLSL
jgi:hypothetical protein